MRDTFQESIEQIAYLQFKSDECISNLNELQLKIITYESPITISKRLELVRMIEDMKPNLTDFIQTKIHSLKEGK